MPPSTTRRSASCMGQRIRRADRHRRRAGRRAPRGRAGAGRVADAACRMGRAAYPIDDLVMSRLPCCRAPYRRHRAPAAGREAFEGVYDCARSAEHPLLAAIPARAGQRRTRATTNCRSARCGRAATASCRNRRRRGQISSPSAAAASSSFCKATRNTIPVRSAANIVAMSSISSPARATCIRRSRPTTSPPISPRRCMPFATSRCASAAMHCSSASRRCRRCVRRGTTRRPGFTQHGWRSFRAAGRGASLGRGCRCRPRAARQLRSDLRLAQHRRNRGQHQPPSSTRYLPSNAAGYAGGRVDQQPRAGMCGLARVDRHRRLLEAKPAPG